MHRSNTNQTTPSSQKGFTLVELAIVLVIIGLIIGGVLVGQDMVKAALVRSQISQATQLSVAVEAFRAKYDCLPGDCATAATYITSATNGDGNGIITDTNGTVAGDATDYDHTTGEVINTWTQVGAAGLGPTGSATTTNTPVPTTSRLLKSAASV